MKRQLLILASLTFLSPGALFGCTQGETQSNQTPAATQAETPATTQTQAATAPSAEGTGKLQVRANGEDFVRAGFVSKDGWKISFDHVYVNLADVTAYQSDPPFNSEKDSEVKAKQKVVLDQAKTLDLAEGDEKAQPILVEEVSNAPAGQYNALSWKMAKAEEGPAKGNTLVMDGTAQKDGQNIDFVIKIDQEYEYVCGEFVGDQRKGILQKDATADLEATFHFDHIFGDADTPASDDLNKGALGFAPLAALAKDGKLEADMAQLKSGLSAEDYQKFEKLLPSLGHVGEGHCKETKTVAQKQR